MGALKPGDRLASIRKGIGVEPVPMELADRTLGVVRVPLTSGIYRVARHEYRGSPRPWSLMRKLLNGVLCRTARTGLFQEGRWVDVGGSRLYGDWLGIPHERYEVLNLPGVADATIAGDMDREGGMELGALFDGVLCLNTFIYARSPEIAIANTAALLKPGGTAVLDFPMSHYWYIGEDGSHWQTFNPFQITNLLHPHFPEFFIVPIGNMLQSCLNYYARRRRLRSASGLIHAAVS